MGWKTAGPRTGKPMVSTGSIARLPAIRCTPLIRRRRPLVDHCTWATSFPTRTPTQSPGSSVCAVLKCSTPWAGTTTDSRPNAGFKTISACAAIRRCPMTPTSPRRPNQASSRSLSRVVTSSNCANTSPLKTRKFLNRFGVDWACPLTGRTVTRPLIRTPEPRHSVRSCAT